MPIARNYWQSALLAVLLLLPSFCGAAGVNLSRNSIFIPYIMSSTPNPFRIVWSGDWAAAFHAWVTLVDFSETGTAVPLLAESWVRSTDGLSWQFKLRANIKWSDGSPMTISQVVQSLNYSRVGTSHTDLASAIFSITETSSDQITFKLSRQVPGFLSSLAYVDWAIVHPKTIETDGTHHKVRALQPCSGPYCIASSQPPLASVDHLDLSLNPFSVIKPKANIRSAKLAYFSSCQELLERSDEMLSFRAYANSMTEQCIKSLGDKGFQIVRSHPGWVLKADFTARGLKTFSLQERHQILLAVQNRLKVDNPGFGVLRATGIRAPHLFGSLTEAEFDNLLSQISLSAGAIAKSKQISRKEISLATMELWSQWPAFEWLRASLVAEGYTVHIQVFSKTDFAKKRASGQLQSSVDLIFMPLGTGDPDPDPSWQIASANLYPKRLDGELIRQAFFEADSAKRSDIYKTLARQLIERGLMIPLRMEADYIGYHKSVRVGDTPQYRTGLTIYDLIPQSL